MKLFKNEVGRPSNEILKKRKIFIVIICAIILVAIIGTIYLLSGSNLSRLRGDGPGAVKKYDYGDINGDAKITLKDVELILNHVYKIKTLKSGTQAYKALDVDRNKKINVNDALAAIRDMNEGTRPGDVNKSTTVDWKDVDYMSAIYEQNLSHKKGSSYYNSLMDINSDGVVNNTDIRLIYRTVSKGYPAGDVTMDGKIDYKDANEMIAIVKEQTKYKYNGRTWSDVYHIADVNHDNKVTVADSDIITILGLTTNGSKVILPGDLNQDGKITQADATFVMNYVRGTAKLTTSKKKYADINNDEKINVTDAALILNIAAGQY